MAVSGVGASGASYATTALPQAILDVYSLDILHKAQGTMRFEDFSVRKEELLAAPGENVKFTIYDEVSRGGQLTEGTNLSTNAMSASQKTITVTEWGNAIAVSEKLLRLSWDDVMAEAATLLGRDYAVVRDLALRDALISGVSNNIFSLATAQVINAVAATDTFDIEAIRRSVEILQTENAPKFYGDYYACFLHPHQAASLRRDPDWVNAHQYAGSRNLFNGEIGRFEDVIFISTTHMPNGAAASTAPGFDSTLDGAGADGIDLYKAVVFGDQCLFTADSLPVELRDNGVEDFGRKHGLAWYSIFGVDVLNPEYGVEIISA